MAKKKSTTSKKKKGKVVTLADGTTYVEEYHNQRITKNVYNSPVPDPEEGKAPKDEASKHKYPPPKKNPVFRAKWMRFIDSVTERENFKMAHLEALEILCDLYVEYDELNKIIRKHGRTYEAISRVGKTIKTRPEVPQISRVQNDIRAYTRMLDLFPKKDHSIGNPEGERDEWD